MIFDSWTVRGILLAGAASVAALVPVQAASADDAELAELDAKLPGELINDPRALLDAVQYGGTAKTKVIKSGDIPGGGAALQVVLDSAPDQAWKVSANMALRGAVSRGDVVTVGFYARALPLENGGAAAGRVGVRIQQNVSPWSGYVDRTIDVGPEWQWYEAAGVATVATPAGGASVTLSLGSQAQKLELGQVIVVKGANAIAGQVKPQIVLPAALKDVAGTLVNRPEAGPWNFYGTGGSQQRIDDKTIFMGKASRVTVPNSAGKPWELATLIPVEGAIKQGDRYLVALAVKTVSASTADGKGTIGLRFQSSQPPWSGFADNVIHPGPNWQLIKLNSTATIDIPAGEAAFSLMFGGTEQVVDVGPVYVMKLD